METVTDVLMPMCNASPETRQDIRAVVILSQMTPPRFYRSMQRLF